jgi:hypothetical protein
MALQDLRLINVIIQTEFVSLGLDPVNLIAATLPLVSTFESFKIKKENHILLCTNELPNIGLLLKCDLQLSYYGLLNMTIK